jgi:hypothetical protein
MITIYLGAGFYLTIWSNWDPNGSSAYVFLNAIRRNCDDAHKIFVETSRLKTISPFGRQVFQNDHPELKMNPDKIILGGKNKASLAPEQIQTFLTHCLSP